MTPDELDKLLKILALIQQGLAKANEILANKATQEGLTTDELFIRANKHNEEALVIINDL